MEYKNRGYNSEDPEVQLGEALEHLQLTLSIEMRRLRKQMGLTQGELGERLGVNQSTVSKMESADVKSDLESLLKYLFALGADLVLGILEGEEFVPVSEAAEEWIASRNDASRKTAEPSHEAAEAKGWHLPTSASKHKPAQEETKATVIDFEAASKLASARRQASESRWNVPSRSQPKHPDSGTDINNDEPIAG